MTFILRQESGCSYFSQSIIILLNSLFANQDDVFFFRSVSVVMKKPNRSNSSK